MKTEGTTLTARLAVFEPQVFATWRLTWWLPTWLGDQVKLGVEASWVSASGSVSVQE